MIFRGHGRRREEGHASKAPEIVTGTIGDHGMAVMAARHKLELDGELRSDVAPINALVRLALACGDDAVTAMKDPTRGGLASALHEMAGKSGVGILLDGARVQVHRIGCPRVVVGLALVRSVRSRQAGPEQTQGGDARNARPHHPTPEPHHPGEG